MGQRGVGLETSGAEHLNRSVYRSLGGLGRMELGHRCLPGQRLGLSNVVGGCRRIHQQLGGLDVETDIGQLMRDSGSRRSGFRTRCVMACPVAMRSAASAIPSAKAPTLGRKRSSVCMATLNP